MEEELGLRDLSRQLLHGGGALSSATKLQQSLFVSGVFDDFSTVVTSLVRGDDLLALGASVIKCWWLPRNPLVC